MKLEHLRFFRWGPYNKVYCKWPQANIHTHTVSLVWGSLRLAPIMLPHLNSLVFLTASSRGYACHSSPESRNKTESPRADLEMVRGVGWLTTLYLLPSCALVLCNVCAYFIPSLHNLITIRSSSNTSPGSSCAPQVVLFFQTMV